jgi:hypothetical protein
MICARFGVKRAWGGKETTAVVQPLLKPSRRGGATVGAWLGVTPCRGEDGEGPRPDRWVAVVGNDPLSVGTDGRRASARDRGGMGRR